MRNDKYHCTTAELAWLCVTLVTRLAAATKPVNHKLAESPPLLHCLGSISVRRLQPLLSELVASGRNNATLEALLQRRRAGLLFRHKHDKLCELYGISEKNLLTLFKLSGCTQCELLSDAFIAAVTCVTQQQYGLNFTPQQILISEIKNRVTPRQPKHWQHKK